MNNILNYLSEKLMMSKADVIKYANSAPHRYKIYEIPKRQGDGKRLIAHPASELKYLQRLLVQYLESELTLHESAFAYRKERGIKQNAQVHLNTRYLLKMDFKNFFPSITPELFFYIMESSAVKISQLEKNLLSGLLFCKYRRYSPLVLSIGAPSSPLISNFVMSSFDEFIFSECDKLKIRYTRYADDITFSTNSRGVLFGVAELVETALKTYLLDQIKINHGKTVYSSKAHNRHVTGITLTNDNNLSIGRERKRIISSMIHKFANQQLAQDSIKKLQGHFAFAVEIEPDFYHKMVSKYGVENIDKIVKYQLDKS